jgi:hypothetical protein
VRGGGGGRWAVWRRPASMFFVPVARSAPMAGLREVGYRARRVAGPQLAGVLGEGGVADAVQGFGLPVAADGSGELGQEAARRSGR